jgi:hypothetical protein
MIEPSGRSMSGISSALRGGGSSSERRPLACSPSAGGATRVRLGLARALDLISGGSAGAGGPLRACRRVASARRARRFVRHVR